MELESPTRFLNTSQMPPALRSWPDGSHLKLKTHIGPQQLLEQPGTNRPLAHVPGLRLTPPGTKARCPPVGANSVASTRNRLANHLVFSSTLAACKGIFRRSVCVDLCLLWVKPRPSAASAGRSGLPDSRPSEPAQARAGSRHERTPSPTTQNGICNRPAIRGAPRALFPPVCGQKSGLPALGTSESLLL